MFNYGILSLSALFPAMPPAVPATELPLAALFAGDFCRTASGACILSIFNGVHILVTLHPFFTTIQTSDRADIPRKIAALYMYDFPIHQTVGNFFPCG